MQASIPDIRNAVPADAPLLERLWRDTFVQAHETVHSASNIEAYCREHFSSVRAHELLADDACLCRVVFRGSNATGFYILVRKACPAALPASSVELKQIYVLASEFGSGLGRALFDDAMARARTLGAQHVWLCVSAKNQRAQAFYRKLGFEMASDGPEIRVGTDRLASLILQRQTR